MQRTPLFALFVVVALRSSCFAAVFRATHALNKDLPARPVF
jgi:hypothetical protein